MVCRSAILFSALGGLAVGASAEPLDMSREIALNRLWEETTFGRAEASGSALTLVAEEGPGDTKVNRCAAGGPLRLGDRVYDRGIGVNSTCELRVALAAPGERLRAIVGLDRNVDGTAGSVRFHVRAGEHSLLSTEVIRAGDRPQAIDVPLSGAREVSLIVDDGGDGRGWDQGDWAEARVELEDGTELWLDELARETRHSGGPPFSFVYGGEPSSELLPTWQSEETLDATDPGQTVRRLTYRDPDTGLELVATSTVYTDCPGVDWVLTITNRGTTDSPVIEALQALDTSLHPSLAGDVVVHRLNGSPCLVDDWMPFDERVGTQSSLEIAATRGRSSNVSPFFNVQWEGGGVITAIGWSGQWAAAVERSQGALTLRARQEDLRTVLHPGESIRSPRILQLWWEGDDPWRGYNLFRRTLLAHVAPRMDGEVIFPPIAHLSTSFYELNASNEENVLSHLRSLDGLGFEVFWLDAYWTGPGGFPSAMGNYGLPLSTVEPPDRFPRGLSHIGDAVRNAGMDFLLWFEPERVAPGTRIATEHPEWVISLAGDGSGLLDLGNPEAWEHIRAYLDTAIREYDLTWLRIDYNIDPLDYWRHADSQQTDRGGMTEMRYVEGLYRLWDALRAAHPTLAIDTCASGGRRIDLETCARAIPLWRSDNTCDMVGDDPEVILQAAIKNQVMSAGLNRYLPLSTVGQMGADPYRFRSGFNGGIAFAEDVRGDDYPRDLLREAIEEGKRLRPYWLGDFYALSEVTTSPRDWCVLQYHRPERDDGIVLAFRRHGSPYVVYDCALRGIEPSAVYRVTFSPTYERGESVELPGSDLARLSLQVTERPGSLLVEYQRVER